MADAKHLIKKKLVVNKLRCFLCLKLAGNFNIFSCNLLINLMKSSAFSLLLKVMVFQQKQFCCRHAEKQTNKQTNKKTTATTTKNPDQSRFLNLIVSDLLFALILNPF